MKKTLVSAALVLIFALALPLCAGASTPAAGAYIEGDAIVVRFRTPQEVSAAVSSTYGLVTASLGGCLQLKPFFSPGIFVIDFSGKNAINADEYRFMKIKFLANTITSTANVYFATNKSNNEITGANSFSCQRRRTAKWTEKILRVGDLSPNWTGFVSAMRIDFFPQALGTLKADEYGFIEYVAFFRTEEEAESFGGLTEEQGNGTDLISLYAKGYRTSRVDGIEYCVPGIERPLSLASLRKPADTDKADETPVRKKITNGQILIIALAAIAGAGAIAVTAILTKPKKQTADGGKAEKDENG